MTYTPRRIRRAKQRWARPFWHMAIDRPRLTQEEVEEIKQRFLTAQRQGVIITSPEIEIRRIGGWR